MTTPTVTSSQVIERVTVLIEALTPTQAPTGCRPETDTPDGFIRHTDNTCKIQSVTDPGRLRLLEVTLQNPKISWYAAGSGSTTLNFDQSVRIRIGYPAEDHETIEDEEYLVEDLRQSDKELIRNLLDGTPFAASGELAALPGVKAFVFQTAALAEGGKVMDIFYNIAFGRAY